MIIKQIDSKQEDLEILQQLQQRPNLSPQTQRKIEQRIRLLCAGIKGEEESAYLMQFHFGNHPDWVIINDLRLQFQNKVAQIDHLLINRHLQIFVCESKRIAGELIINEFGEFSRRYNGQGQGMPSPLEQNKRHISILKQLLQKKRIQCPSLCGLYFKPLIYSLILISNDSSIRRPKKTIAGLDNIIKNEQLQEKVKQLSKPLGIFSIIRTVSRSRLEEFAHQLVKLHHPQKHDWLACFGLNKINNHSANIATSPQPQTETLTPVKKFVSYFCVACRKNISPDAANYCWNHKNIFGGKAYCYQCQQIIRQKQQ